MPNPNAVVSSVIRLKPALEQSAAELLRSEEGLTVELDGERQARLDPENPRSEGFAHILDGLSKQRLPVYLEVDPETSVITHLLIPHVARIIDIHLIDLGVLGVDLDVSHGRHVLRQSSPDFKELEGQLREAQRAGTVVIITENDAHEIIDIRDFRPDADSPTSLPRPRTIPGKPWFTRLVWKIWRWPWWPWWWLLCISQTKAQQFFDAMSATSCNPITVPPPCIPFLYPDDGCWGRAHEMCRLMINMGLKPRKVWIQGNLHVSTKNNPNCNVWWGWHVAPTLCVRCPTFPKTQELVIDPSLFTTPVTKPAWKAVQGDPNATLTDTSASIFLIFGNQTDPTYSKTNTVLATYRMHLQNRSIQHGPPPYANCP